MYHSQGTAKKVGQARRDRLSVASAITSARGMNSPGATPGRQLLGAHNAAAVLESRLEGHQSPPIDTKVMSVSADTYPLKARC